MWLLRSGILLASMLLALAALFGARHTRGAFGPWLAKLTATAFAVEVLAMIMALYHHANTPVYNLFTTVEFVLFLRLVLIALPEKRSAIIISLCLGLLVMVISLGFHRDSTFLLTEGIISMAAISTIWSLVILWRAAQSSEDALVGQPYFWFFMGAMIYFGGIVPFVGMMRYLYQNDPALTRLLYMIISIAAIVRYLFTAWSAQLARSRNDWEPHGR